MAMVMKMRMQMSMDRKEDHAACRSGENGGS